MTHERRFNPELAHRLISPEREARWQPRQFLEKLGLNTGQQVVDLGCGPGFWTFPLAEVVGPTGTVWAVDISPEMLQLLRERGLPEHVRPVLAALPDVPLPEKCVDWVWTAFTFHEVEPFPAFAALLARLVRPAGHVIVLEWRPDAASEQGPPRHHRLAPEQIQSWLIEAGLTHVHLVWQDEDTYLITARGR